MRKHTPCALTPSLYDGLSPSSAAPNIYPACTSSQKYPVENWTGTTNLVVYGLIDPLTGDCRYIGLSSSGLRRPKSHGNTRQLAKDRSYKGNWIRQLFSNGHVFTIRILRECNALTELKLAEQSAIAEARRLGWPLTNLTDGGDGLLNPSPETRAKIGAYSKARMSTQEYIDRAIGARRGTILPREWADKVAAAQIGRKHSPEHIAKVADKQRGRKRGKLNLSEDARARIGAPHKGVPKSAAQRAKMSAALKGRIFSPEHRANISIAQKARFLAEKLKKENS